MRASGRRERDSLDDLTPQELQIVQTVTQGLSSWFIAERLYLSRRTVEWHLYRVFPKLGVRLARAASQRPGLQAGELQLTLRPVIRRGRSLDAAVGTSWLSG